MRILSVFILFVVPGVLLAQSTNATLNEDYYHWIDRYEVKAGRIAPELFTSVKPYRRSMIVAFIDSLNAKDGVFTSRQDKFNHDFLRDDSWEWSRSETSNSRRPILKELYKKKSDFYNVDVPDFDLHVSPVLYLGVGRDSRLSENTFINTRGIEIRGMIDRNVGFYTFFTDNQSILPSYVRDQVTLNPVIPHEGFWKTFKSDGVDFFQARGYIDFSVTKHINMQFGHDRTFIGNGYRSLIFSDTAPPHLFLRANAKVWRLNYMFQLNRVISNTVGSAGGSGGGGGRRYPEKYIAFHHASINIGRKLNVGFFESVVFNPRDSAVSNSFELSYLNPVIFYRAIEQQAGSSDNAILGMDFKWNAAKYISFYGQVVLDEFLLNEIKSGNGWWANKYALQGGMKYIDVAGISNLDLQVEANVVRPYTYSHNTPAHYSSYRQPLAHPLGANFYELVGIIRYQPIPRLNVIAKSFFVKKGQDGTGGNQGGNILQNNSVRPSDYGNTIGQGVENKISFVDLTASYQFKHNLFIDVKQVMRVSKSPAPFYNTNTSVTSVALRWNIPQRLYDF
jgi:hypothetical protein